MKIMIYQELPPHCSKKRHFRLYSNITVLQHFSGKKSAKIGRVFSRGIRQFSEKLRFWEKSGEIRARAAPAILLHSSLSSCGAIILKIVFIYGVGSPGVLTVRCLMVGVQFGETFFQTFKNFCMPQGNSRPHKELYWYRVMPADEL